MKRAVHILAGMVIGASLGAGLAWCFAIPETPTDNGWTSYPTLNDLSRQPLMYQHKNEHHFPLRLALFWGILAGASAGSIVGAIVSRREPPASGAA